DQWLQTNIDPLVKSATFQRDGLLVIVFDEAGSDNTDGGGHVPCVIVSPKAKRGYQGVGVYQHQSLLRLTGEALGLRTLPNAAARRHARLGGRVQRSGGASGTADAGCASRHDPTPQPRARRGGPGGHAPPPPPTPATHPDRPPTPPPPPQRRRTLRARNSIV